MEEADYPVFIHVVVWWRERRPWREEGGGSHGIVRREMPPVAHSLTAIHYCSHLSCVKAELELLCLKALSSLKEASLCDVCLLKEKSV